MLIQKKADWPLEFRVIGLDVKRGTKFYGTKSQLKKYISTLNKSMTNGTWDVDRKQLPDIVV